MEANEMNILDLNDYCLGQILKYLKLEDQMRFADTCNRFREVFRDWYHVLYPEHQLTLYYEPARSYSYIKTKSEDGFDWVTKRDLDLKLLDIVEDIIKRLYIKIMERYTFKSRREPEIFAKICKRIEKMINLEELEIDERLRNDISTNTLVFTPIPIERILAGLEGLPKLKKVSLACGMTTPRLECLKRLKCLESFSTETEIALQDLIEICKSNENLKILWAQKYNWDIEALLPHCPNIEEIAFTIEDSQKSYAAIAQLAKIKGVHVQKSKSKIPNPNLSQAFNVLGFGRAAAVAPMSSCGKLIELFDAFAHRGKDSKLEKMVIFSKLTLEETTKLIQLVDLKFLCCIFEDAKSIELLTNLTKLERLYMVSRGDSLSGPHECLNVLKSCRKLQLFHMNIIVKPGFLDNVLEVLKSVRDPEKQKPLEIFIMGRKQQLKVDKDEYKDNAYITLVDKSDYLRPTLLDRMCFNMD